MVDRFGAAIVGHGEEVQPFHQFIHFHIVIFRYLVGRHEWINKKDINFIILDVLAELLEQGLIEHDAVARLCGERDVKILVAQRKQIGDDLGEPVGLDDSVEPAAHLVRAIFAVPIEDTMWCDGEADLQDVLACRHCHGLGELKSGFADAGVRERRGNVLPDVVVAVEPFPWRRIGGTVVRDEDWLGGRHQGGEFGGVAVHPWGADLRRVSIDVRRGLVVGIPTSFGFD